MCVIHTIFAKVIQYKCNWYEAAIFRDTRAANQRKPFTICDDGLRRGGRRDGRQRLVPRLAPVVAAFLKGCVAERTVAAQKGAGNAGRVRHDAEVATVAALLEDVEKKNQMHDHDTAQWETKRMMRKGMDG